VEQKIVLSELQNASSFIRFFPQRKQPAATWPAALIVFIAAMP
jgi:hypothetical protein